MSAHGIQTGRSIDGSMDTTAEGEWQPRTSCTKGARAGKRAFQIKINAVAVNAQ